MTDDAQADLLAALFWGSFTVMRGMGVFIAMRLSPLQMIAGGEEGLHELPSMFID